MHISHFISSFKIAIYSSGSWKSGRAAVDPEHFIYLIAFAPNVEKYKILTGGLVNNPYFLGIVGMKMQLASWVLTSVNISPIHLNLPTTHQRGRQAQSMTAVKANISSSQQSTVSHYTRSISSFECNLCVRQHILKHYNFEETWQALTDS